MMAPASQPSEMPSIVPALIIATPMVPMVVHELPESTETMAVSRNTTSRNIFGLMSFMP